jgi:superfamily I DNA and RNA helicase
MKDAVMMLNVHVIRSDFHKDWFSHSKSNKITGSQKQQGELISIVLFLKQEQLSKKYFRPRNIIYSLVKHFNSARK